ncbi:LysR family transcriptional regulator substrate-binding protein [Bradyrhizobium sp. McL0615]|uniref:LysR family transcriptional regulator substrate-binding protein n=1 Tax=Bradyrhizobium sp. McL0615 TaxID=3415673 RepID=UPI003CFB63D9
MRALLDRGLVAFDELKQGIEHVDFLANPTTGELRIGSTIAIATGFLPAVVDRMLRKYPRVIFHLSAGEAAMTYRTLEERTVDVVIAPVFASMAVEHLHAEILYEEPLVVVAGARSVWANRRKIELAELAGATWTLPPLCMARSSPRHFGPTDWIFPPQPSSRPSRPRATLCSPPAVLSASFRVR